MIEKQESSKTKIIDKEMLKQSFQPLIDRYIPEKEDRKFTITYTFDWKDIRPARSKEFEEYCSFVNGMPAKIWSTILLLDENGDTLGTVGEKIHPAKPVRWYRQKPVSYKIFDPSETAAEAITRVGVEKQVKYLLDVDTRTLYL